MPEHVNAGDCMGVWAELGAQIPSESGLGVHAQPRMQSICDNSVWLRKLA